MLTNIEKIAIGKAGFKVTDRLPVGEHKVDALVRIRGTVKVGENYSRTPTVSVPLKETLALFIAYSGITRKAATEALVKAMNTALETSDAGKGAIAKALPIVNDTMAVVQESILSKLGKVTVNGAVTSKLEIEALRDLLDKVGDHEVNYNVIDGALVVV